MMAIPAGAEMQEDLGPAGEPHREECSHANRGKDEEREEGLAGREYVQGTWKGPERVPLELEPEEKPHPSEAQCHEGEEVLEGVGGDEPHHGGSQHEAHENEVGASPEEEPRAGRHVLG